MQRGDRSPMARTCKLPGASLAVLILFCSIGIPVHIRADGGSVCLSKIVDGYRITLFVAPASPRVGQVDFSVLVQSAGPEIPVPDLPVTIFAHPEAQPLRRLGGPATKAAATNKLFSALQVELAEPGKWHVEVEVGAPDRTLRVDGDLEVAPPSPSWIEFAPWIGWPAPVIALFVVHQYLVRGQRKRRLR